jgi:hypothetical protein
MEISGSEEARAVPEAGCQTITFFPAREGCRVSQITLWGMLPISYIKLGYL